MRNLISTRLAIDKRLRRFAADEGQRVQTQSDGLRRMKEADLALTEAVERLDKPDRLPIFLPLANTLSSIEDVLAEEASGR
jgi:hypothetical protein